MGKSIGLGILAFVGLLLLGAAMDASGIFWESKVGIWRSDVQRQNFEHTKVYNDGKLQELSEYHHEYLTSDEIGKKAVASLVRHQYAGYDTRNLPPDLAVFVSQCEEQ